MLWPCQMPTACSHNFASNFLSLSSFASGSAHSHNFWPIFLPKHASYWLPKQPWQRSVDDHLFVPRLPCMHACTAYLDQSWTFDQVLSVIQANPPVKSFDSTWIAPLYFLSTLKAWEAPRQSLKSLHFQILQIPQTKEQPALTLPCFCTFL